jgi:hypothetical protein
LDIQSQDNIVSPAFNLEYTYYNYALSQKQFNFHFSENIGMLKLWTKRQVSALYQVCKKVGMTNRWTDGQTTIKLSLTCLQVNKQFKQDLHIYRKHTKNIHQV